MDFNDRYQIRILTSADKKKVEQLLKESFANPVGFTTESVVSKWSQSDDYYPSLGLFFKDRLLAYLRVEWIGSDAEFVVKVGESKVPFKFNYPIGYVAKTATHPKFQRQRLNLILRYHAFRIFDYWKVNGVAGTMVEGSPRVNTLRKLGYYFFEKEKKWSGLFKSEKKVLLALLDGPENISKAMEKIEKDFSQCFEMVDVHFNLSQVPMRGRSVMDLPWEKKTKAS